MAGLYLHIPYCETKCLYCDFYSIENRDSTGDFLAALGREIDIAGSSEPRERYNSIFFGGGTPSLLPPEAVGGILGQLHRTFDVTGDAEITLETNPGTVDRRRLGEFLHAGINRLSIGVQSFHQEELTFLSRIHTAEEAERCVKDAYASGFTNVSIDLIFALPGQTPERWRRTLERAFRLRPKHISAYSLIVEENTPLASLVSRGAVTPMSEDDEASLYEMTMAMMEEGGYRQYEVSNFAIPGYESRHNSGYWNHSGYLGFGPSAHSFRRESARSGTRWWNVRNITQYCARLAKGELPIAGSEHIGAGELYREAILLGLRSRGIDLAEVRERYGIDLLRDRAAVIGDYARLKLLTIDGTMVRLNRTGFPLCDAIVESLL